MSAWSIHPILLADHAACVALWRSCEGLGDVPDHAAFASFIARNPELSPLARDGERVIGVMLASFDGIRGYLYRLAVDPARRRQGIAGALVTAATQRLRAAGASRINLHVFAGNAPALAFWTSQGWASCAGLEMWRRRLDQADG